MRRCLARPLRAAGEAFFRCFARCRKILSRVRLWTRRSTGPGRARHSMKHPPGVGATRSIARSAILRARATSLRVASRFARCPTRRCSARSALWRGQCGVWFGGKCRTGASSLTSSRHWLGSCGGRWRYHARRRTTDAPRSGARSAWLAVLRFEAALGLARPLEAASAGERGGVRASKKRRGRDSNPRYPFGYT
jgi:hypothetical protein